MRDETVFAADFRVRTARTGSERYLPALERFWDFRCAGVLINRVSGGVPGDVARALRRVLFGLQPSADRHQEDLA